jgi:Fe-S cluster biogenesis protein NfuA
MPSETYLTGVVKIHQNCGGQVRLVEDLTQRSVEFSGQCLHCASSKIPKENCIFLYEDDLPGEFTKRDIVETPTQDLQELEWDDRWSCYEDAVDGGLLDQVQEVLT